MTDFAAQIDAIKARTGVDIRRQIASTAKQKHAEIMAADPRPLSFVRHVDGIQGAPEEAVRPDGVIVYDYNRLDEVVSVTLDTLRQLSPVKDGDYVRSHTVFLNGQPVDDIKEWRPGDEIMIANTMPYSRKIEVGRKGFRAHPHVYERAEQIVSRRFGNLADISFDFRPIPFGDIASFAATTRLHRAGHPSKRADWLISQPAIVIRELG